MVSQFSADPLLLSEKRDRLIVVAAILDDHRPDPDRGGEAVQLAEFSPGPFLTDDPSFRGCEVARLVSSDGTVTEVFGQEPGATLLEETTLDFLFSGNNGEMLYRGSYLH